MASNLRAMASNLSLDQFDTSDLDVPHMGAAINAVALPNDATCEVVLRKFIAEDLERPPTS